MIRCAALALALFPLFLTGCDNRTHDGVRYDQIESNLVKNADVQPWSEAKELWRKEGDHQPVSW